MRGAQVMCEPQLGPNLLSLRHMQREGMGLYDENLLAASEKRCAGSFWRRGRTCSRCQHTATPSDPAPNTVTVLHQGQQSFLVSFLVSFSYNFGD